MGLQSQNAPLMPCVAATLLLLVMGGRFEDEGVVPPSMGNACQFLAMLLAAAGLPSSELLALACVPKGGGWRARLVASQ